MALFDKPFREKPLSCNRSMWELCLGYEKRMLYGSPVNRFTVHTLPAFTNIYRPSVLIARIPRHHASGVNFRSSTA